MTKLKQILNSLLGIGPIEYDIVYRVATTPMNMLVEGNSVIFINQGDTTVTIDNVLVIDPNDSISIPGELFEYMNRSFNINFTGTGANNFLAMIKRYR